LATKAVRKSRRSTEETRNVRLMNDENPCEQMSKRGELQKSGQNSRRIRKKVREHLLMEIRV